MTIPSVAAGAAARTKARWTRMLPALAAALIPTAAASPGLASSPGPPPPAADTASVEDPLAILPQGEGRDVFLKVCSGCHVPTIVARQRHTAEGWTDVVVSMIDRGAKGSDEEFEAAIAYLAKAFPQEGASSGAVRLAAALAQEKRR